MNKLLNLTKINIARFKLFCGLSSSGNDITHYYERYFKNKLGWSHRPTMKFSYVGTSNIQKRSHLPCSFGFTLAEVLITLGIIGVVAAMTLPTLIQNYQKQVVITRLKYAYNVFSNVLKRAEADYGNITEWGLDSEGLADYSSIDKGALRESFVRKYMLPYISDAKFTTDKSLSYYGYKREITRPSGSMSYPVDYGAPMVIQFKNGMIIIVNVGTATSADDPDKKVVSGLNFVIDVDGPSGQNRMGRDVYWANVPYVTNSRFMFWRDFTISDNKVLTLKPVTRASLISDCKESGTFCATLIQQDGWQIKDDYPW